MMTEKCCVCSDSSPCSEKGMFIRGNFLCWQCEAMIACLTPEDLYYPFVKNALKKIWVEKRVLRYEC